MKYDVIIVGGGIAGLTAAAFLAKQHQRVLLCEKEDHVGGLVSSFSRDGFLYDAGLRGIVDSGIVKPMLKQLGIQIDFVKSLVTIGVENEMMKVESPASLIDYQAMLVRLYPENEKEIQLILDEIKKVMDYMDILYGIENPLFMDLKKDRTYVVQRLLPWLFKFIKKSGKIKQFQVPVDEYLQRFTSTPSLIDIISQHFFQKTPASFALSYFSLYLDYEYPRNGTSELVYQMEKYILQAGGTIQTSTTIVRLDANQQIIQDANQQTYAYDQLIWAADMNRLYHALDLETIVDPHQKSAIQQQKDLLVDKKAGDSIYSLFLAVDLDKAYFQQRSSGHCFYTPNKQGQSQVFHQLTAISSSNNKEEIWAWMDAYLDYTTYEIAIPSLRNPLLAPEGKTGLVISVLMDYHLIKQIQSLGFYEEFKARTEQKIIQVLERSLYPGLQEKLIHCFSSTPLTIEKLSGNHEGGITGWAFTNSVIPSISKMTQVSKSCLTPIPKVLQAGQWTYSPSGLPISILTGKIAAYRAMKQRKK